MPDQARSLQQLYPRHLEVPALLVLTLASLITALMLPFMKIDKLVFWKDHYTLLTSMHAMWKAGDYFLAAIIFMFSIVFPYVKLGTLSFLWFKPVDSHTRDKLLTWLGILGKWSMLDVFVVALLIVMTQSKRFIDASPQAGLYVFASAIICSIMVSLWVERLAKRAGDA